MAAHNELGLLGEQLAEQYLMERGYEIVDRNWRYSRYELDLVAVKANVLHFIEVKTRSTTVFGMPEDAVDYIKVNRLIAAGEQYLEHHPEFKHIQFDVLSICMRPFNEVEYFLIEDVYY